MKVKTTTLNAIYDIQSHRDAELSVIEQQLNEARAELITASNTLEISDNEFEYSDATERVRKAKERITCLNRFKAKKSIPLTDEERREIERNLKEEHTAITAKYADMK